MKEEVKEVKEEERKRLFKNILNFALIIAVIFLIIINFYSWLHSTEPSIQSIQPTTNEQNYNEFLKQMGEQYQRNIDSQTAKFSFIVGSLALVTGFFTVGLIFISFIGWQEFEKIREQKSKIQDVLDKYEELVKEEEGFKDLARFYVKNSLDYAVANVFFRLGELDFADSKVQAQIFCFAKETIEQIEEVEENGEFGIDVKLFKGKITYKLKDYDKAREHLENVEEKLNKLSGSKNSKKILNRKITLYDLMGAIDKKSFKSNEQETQHLVNAEKHFNDALEKIGRNLSDYDKKRIWSNIQVIKLLQNDTSEVINIYNKRFKGKIKKQIESGILKQKLKSEKLQRLDRIELGVYITAIDAYFEEKKPDWFDMLKHLEELYGNLETMKNHIKNNFNVKEDRFDEIIGAYENNQIIYIDEKSQ